MARIWAKIAYGDRYARYAPNDWTERFSGFHPYDVVLYFDDDSGVYNMTLPFFVGSLFGGDPTIEDVMDCMHSDCASLEEDPSFEEWAFNMGFDPDSRKDERIFRELEFQVDSLRNILGEEHYDRWMRDPVLWLAKYHKQQ